VNREVKANLDREDFRDKEVLLVLLVITDLKDLKERLENLDWMGEKDFQESRV
jgi:hypothetical protein